jgi:DivIVA domain
MVLVGFLTIRNGKKRKLLAIIQFICENIREKVIDMEKEFQLDIDKILNQEFSVDFKGYSPQEVDQFLDMVIQDFQTYDSVIEELEERLRVALKNNASLKNSITELEGKVSSFKNMDGNINQIDLIRRIARLEEIVFRKK